MRLTVPKNLLTNQKNGSYLTHECNWGECKCKFLYLSFFFFFIVDNRAGEINHNNVGEKKTLGFIDQ